jgi:hypothetical protein
MREKMQNPLQLINSLMATPQGNPDVVIDHSSEEERKDGFQTISHELIGGGQNAD